MSSIENEEEKIEIASPKEDENQIQGVSKIQSHRLIVCKHFGLK